MITFPISIPPNPQFKVVDWRVFDPTVLSTSIFTGQSQKLDRFGAHWLATLACPPMSEAQGVDWSVFMTSMRGRVGSFYFGHPTRGTAKGTIAGAPVCTATARDREITLTLGTGTLKAGDFLQIGITPALDYVMVMEDVANIATDPVTIEPPLKNDHAAAPVVYDNPVGIFELTSDENGWNVEESQIYGFSLSIKESF